MIPPALLLLVLLLTGCASDNVSYQEATREELQAMAGYPVDGFAKWTLWDCTVYMLPPDQYRSVTCYELVLDHELRHCDEGAFHPATPAGSYTPGADGKPCQ